MRIKLFGKTIEIKASTSALPSLQSDSGWVSYLAGRGYSVSADTALQISAVFRCVDIITKTIAALPPHMYKNTDKGKEKAEEHPVYQLVHMLPNRHTTSYEFWQMYVANLLLTRGAFAKIQRKRGFITELWNIPTANVSGIHVNSVNGERYIDVNLDDGAAERLHEGEFMYTPGFLFSSRTEPNDPMKIASEVLGLTDSIKEYAKQAVNGINPGGFIEYPQSLSDQAYARFKTDFDANYKGTVNAGKFIFLEEGGKAAFFDRDMEKMQVLESRRYAVTEICRIFGVPPHMCMDLDRATFSNIEQQSGEYVRDCVNPLSVRLEQTMYKDLLTSSERTVYYFKFNTDALLRGDTAARTQLYNTMRQTGVYSVNDVLRLEDQPIIPEEEGGEDHHLNGNMITLKNARANIPKGGQAKGVTQ